jgi:hypothetical protein
MTPALDHVSATSLFVDDPQAAKACG